MRLGRRGVWKLKGWFRKTKNVGFGNCGSERQTWVSETGFRKLERWVSATRQICSEIVVRQLGTWVSETEKLVSETRNVGFGNWNMGFGTTASMGFGNWERSKSYVCVACAADVIIPDPTSPPTHPNIHCKTTRTVSETDKNQLLKPTKPFAETEKSSW